MKTENITLSTNEKIGLISNFATMLSAGIPILDAVDSLLDGAKNSQKKVLQVLKDDISQGQHVSASFMKFPKVFDKVTIQIIKASEEAGTLEVTLRDLRNDIKKQAEFTDKVKSALMYPIFIVGVFGCVLLLMITFVIPKISSVFLKLHVDLPLPTRVLIEISNFVLAYKTVSVVGLILFIIITIYLVKKKRDLLLGMIGSLPVVDDLMMQIDLTKFSRSLFLLLQAGIPITSALELSQDTVTRNDLKAVITQCKETVMGGKKLSEGFLMAKNVVPNIFIKITEAGERSGSLDKSMQDISEHFEYEVSTKLKAVTSLIEPVMLVFVGVLIGGMMLAIIAPIYNLISQITAR